MLNELTHLAVGLAPVADALAGTVASDIVNMSQYGAVRFIFFWGVGVTGTGTITVEACDDVVPTNAVAIPFYARRYQSPDTEAAIAAVAAAGLLITAGSNQVYAVEVSANALGSSGYKYCRAKWVEVTDSPILGGILIELSEPRYVQGEIASAVV